MHQRQLEKRGDSDFGTVEEIMINETSIGKFDVLAGCEREYSRIFPGQGHRH